MMTVVEATSNSTVLARVCPFCGKTHRCEFPMAKDELEKRMELRKSMCIQNIFPEFNADQREFLMTGICPKCWSNM